MAHKSRPESMYGLHSSVLLWLGRRCGHAGLCGCAMALHARNTVAHPAYTESRQGSRKPGQPSVQTQSRDYRLLSRLRPWTKDHCISFEHSRSLCSLLPPRINQRCASYSRTTAFWKRVGLWRCLIRKRRVVVSCHHGELQADPTVTKISSTICLL